MMKQPKTSRRVHASPSEKQQQQRKLVMALGKVKGLNGWVCNTVEACRAARINGITLLHLEQAQQKLLNQCKIAEEDIRKKLKTLTPKEERAEDEQY